MDYMFHLIDYNYSDPFYPWTPGDDSAIKSLRWVGPKPDTTVAPDYYCNDLLQEPPCDPWKELFFRNLKPGSGWNAYKWSCSPTGTNRQEASKDHQ